MSLSAFQPVHQETTPMLISKLLRRAIGRGELAPGQQLNEAELSRSLGVSRGPLREALQRLTQEGLLTAIRNRGVFVIDVTDDDMRDMYRARTAIERAAVERAIELDPRAAGEALLEIVNTMENAAAEDDHTSVTDADVDFHVKLVEFAGSRRLIRMHTTLMVETRMCITALEASYMTHDFRIREHRAISEAIIAGDAATADRLLREHMDDAVERLVPHEESMT